MKSLLTERVVASPQPTVVDLVWLEEGNTPPSDSVLDRALPELLRLSEDEIDQLWESLGRLAVDDLVLSDATLLAMRRPYLCAEDSLEILVSSAIGYLQSLFLSDPPFDELLAAALAEISARVGRDVRPSADSLSSQSFISGVADGFGALPLSAIPGTDLLESCLGDQRVHRIGDLSGVSESSLFRAAGFGALTLRVARMCWSLREELIWLSGLGKPPDGAEPPRSLCDEMRLALSMSLALPPGGSREKAIRVVLRRLGVESGRPMTLEEAASAFGLTRQRIRQIEAKAVDALNVTAFLAELVPLRVDIFCTLAAHGWGMLTAELARDLAVRRGWADSPSVEALEAVTAMLPECDADSAEEVVLLAGAGCSQCDAMAEVLDEIRMDGSAVPVSEVRSRLVRAAANTRRECTMCAEHDPKVFAALLDIALDGQVDLVRDNDGWLLPQTQSGRRPNSLAFRAQEALRRSGRCMHFREVAEVLARDNPAKAPPTPRSVYAALDRVPDAVSWGAGSFIHKECMPFPYQVVRGVEEWITERFNSPATPQMLSVHGVYQRFEGDCVSHGVPSELALYSLLRMSGEPSLVYPQYPQIHWQARFEQRLPLALVLDDFVRNASGPVTMEELRQFVMDEMGFKEFQLTQALAELPNVHETADGPFLHIDGAHGPGVYGLVDGARRGPARDSSKRDTSSADDAGSDRIVDAQFDSASSEHVASSPIAKGERRIPEATPCSDCQPARTHLLGLASGDGRAMHILDAAHSVVATCCRECKDGPPSAVDAYVVRRLLQDTDDVVVDDDRIYDLLSWRLFQSPQLVDAAEGALHRLGGEACLVEIADTIRSNNATWGAATNAQVSATLYVQKRRFELLGRAVFRLKDGSSTHPPEVPEEPGPKPSRSASQLRVAQTAEDIEFRGDD